MNWLEEQRQLLLQACIDAGVRAEDLRCQASQKNPYGRWNDKAVVLAAEVPVARYWVTFPTKIPKFNIQTSHLISQQWQKLQSKP